MLCYVVFHFDLTHFVDVFKSFQFGNTRWAPKEPKEPKELYLAVFIYQPRRSASTHIYYNNIPCVIYDFSIAFFHLFLFVHDPGRKRAAIHHAGNFTSRPAELHAKCARQPVSTF